MNSERTQPIQARPSAPRPAPGNAVLETYRTPHALRRLLAAASVLAWSLAIVLGAVGAYRWGMAALYYGPVAMMPWSGPWLLAALLAVAVASWLTVITVHARRRSVHVLRSGLLLQSGKERVHVPWESIARIYTSAVSYRVPILSRPRLSIELASHSGRRVGFPPLLDGADRLLTTVKAQVYPRLLNEARQAFNSGQAVQFGPLRLDRQGVWRDQHLLPWRDLAGARLERGRLSIQPGRGRPWRLPVRRIPNADLCLQLVTLIHQDPS